MQQFFFILFSIFFLFLSQCKPEISEKEPEKKPPTDIVLTPDIFSEDKKIYILENEPIGKAIGLLFAIGGDGEPESFSLVSGQGDDDNGDFTIDRFTLKSAKSFDYETKNTYKIRIKAIDENDKTFEKTFVIDIKNVNEDPNPPTDLALSSDTIDEGIAGRVIGTFTTTDATVGDSFTYSFDFGDDNDDNNRFEIDGNKLKSKQFLDYELKPSFKIRIKVADKEGNNFDKPFVIKLTDVTERISYAYNSGSKYIEAAANDGSIDNSDHMVISADSGLKFNFGIGTVYGLDKFYTVANVPDGLTVVLTKLSDITAKLTFAGKAKNNVRSSIKNDGLNNILVTLKSDIFFGAPDLSGLTKTTALEIQYLYDPPVFSYTYYQSEEKVFVESAGDDGAINGNFRIEPITVANAAFSGGNGQVTYTKDTHYTVANLPAGLSLTVTKNAGLSFLFIGFSGKATSHASSDSVNNFSITLLPAILNNDIVTGNKVDLSAVPSKTQNNMKIIFDSAGYMLFEYNSRKITENSATPGKIAESPRGGFIQNITFNASVNDNDYFTEGTHYTISGNKPAGIDIKIKKTGSTGFRMEPSGTVTKHSSADNTEFTINFLSAAFQGSPDIDTIINTSHKIRVEYDD